MDYKLIKNKKEFATLLSKLGVEEFFGVCRIMNIPVIDVETKDFREGEDLIVEVLEKFPTYNRTQRRNLLRILRAAVKSAPAKEVKEDEPEN